MGLVERTQEGAETHTAWRVRYTRLLRKSDHGRQGAEGGENKKWRGRKRK